MHMYSWFKKKIKQMRGHKMLESSPSHVTGSFHRCHHHCVPKRVLSEHCFWRISILLCFEPTWNHSVLQFCNFLFFMNSSDPRPLSTSAHRDATCFYGSCVVVHYVDVPRLAVSSWWTFNLHGMFGLFKQSCVCILGWNFDSTSC